MMKVVLIQDAAVNIDLERSCKILNSVCNTIKFESNQNTIDTDLPLSYINFGKEASILDEMLSHMKKDCMIYITSRRYEDNYFFYSSNNNIMILSLWGWEHYTNLPLENGLFYFIAGLLALAVDDSSRHDETTGCIYDFLWDKTGVDLGMKMAYICEDCLTRVRNRVEKSKPLSDTFLDFIEILNSLSTASKWGKSVLDLGPNQSQVSLNWSTFENEVAQIYRQLGASVKQNMNLAGFQIDIYLEEETPSKQKVRTAIECKFYKTKVGNRIVNDFSRIVQTLKESGLVDKGIIVSYSGFSQDAFLVSEKTGIELCLFEDLKQRAGIREKVQKDESIKSTQMMIHEKELQIKEKKERSPKIFVVMPFSPDLDDVYYLGIHETAKDLNCSCERVDEMEFVGGILGKVYDSIAQSKIIIAEVSFPNPNVYYEIGYAHALRKPVVLITKDISSTPFDLRSYNHIAYKNIRDLRAKLKSRLEAILVKFI